MKRPETFRMGVWWRVKHYAPKVLRLAVFLVAVWLGAILILGYRVRAQVGDALFDVGAEMLRYEGARRMDAPRTLVLNGQPIRLASAVTDHPLERVLDWYEARCLEHDGELGEQLAELMDGRPALDGVEPSLFDAILREEAGDRGYVACLDMGRERLDAAGLAGRFDRFRRSLDVSDLGDLRYIYGEQNDEGTFFVAFWTEGPFRIGSMFPAAGDVPGQDPEGIPRPPDGRRLLSAWEEGHRETVTMYGESARAPSELVQWYRGEMPERGWHLLEPDAAFLARTGQRRPGGVLVYERDQEMVTLVFGKDRAGASFTTVLRSR